ncbi:hypothetical protein [Deinococcus hopiensis]|nr:hypothetical protein [Deinococcus hopiensis]
MTALAPQEGAWRDVFYRHLRGLQAVVASFTGHMDAQQKTG